MLRASAQAFGFDLNIDAVRDPSASSGIPDGQVLLELVDAVMLETEPLDTAQHKVIDTLGADALADAAAVFGNFEMMNRVADGTGIPVAGAAIERERGLIDRLDIEGLLHH